MRAQDTPKNLIRAIPETEYKHLLDPYGVEKCQQKMIQKETESELVQM